MGSQSGCPEERPIRYNRNSAWFKDRQNRPLVAAFESKFEARRHQRDLNYTMACASFEGHTIEVGV